MESIDYFERAYSIILKFQGDQSTLLPDVLDGLAIIYIDQGQL